ncbi:MAG: hypothetical protein WEA08_00505 [Woeseia sp.]
MMKTYTRISFKCMALMLSGLLAVGAVQAQTDEERDNQKTKEAQAVSKKVYDRIQEAQALIDEKKDYNGALRVLNGLRRGDSLTEYEQQNVLNYIGFVHYNMDNIKEAMATYEEMLRIPSIEPQIRKQTLYTLAQLSTMQEDYPKALRLMEEWFALEENPGPAPFILYAQNLYQVERYADMVEPIETAMRIARERDDEIKEDWYVLLNFAYFQQENFAKVRDIQKTLLMNWPKKRYWFSLAGAYTELGEDKNLIAAYDAAHTQGLLERENELVTMAQLYMQAEVPYKAGQLLEKEMESGRVSKDAKNYRLLSQAWSLAQEDDKAIPALQEAARRSDDGELYLRLGNSYLNVANYSDCADAVREGLEKGGIKSPDNAHITLGMCLYNQNKYAESIRAFREASKTDRSRRIARQWISVIESDIERIEQIRLAEEAAERQAEQLERRLARARAERI